MPQLVDGSSRVATHLRSLAKKKSAMARGDNESAVPCRVTKHVRSSTVCTAAAVLCAAAMCVAHAHRVRYKANQTTVVVSSGQPTNQPTNTWILQRWIRFVRRQFHCTVRYGKQARSAVFWAMDNDRDNENGNRVLSGIFLGTIVKPHHGMPEWVSPKRRTGKSGEDGRWVHP
mmetsp:Transcript_7706/g.15047  ORF Transcript_7706/g.15047 Transcript_7706/m.15047 type:complete len:173 (+) Transcript_7706:509-1027(+)